MQRFIALILCLSLYVAASLACPVVLEMGLNQSGLKISELSEFNDSFNSSGFTATRGDAQFKFIFQLLKRKNRVNEKKKFAWGSVSVYDQNGKLVAYTFRKGASSKNESKAYSSKNFDHVMNELLEELPACI